VESTGVAYWRMLLWVHFALCGHVTLSDMTEDLNQRFQGGKFSHYGKTGLDSKAK
jgi:hypothetical protein